jgi:hypothetical protein
VGARRQTQHENAGIWITEAWNGPSPVLPIHVGSTLLAADLLPEFDQAWAAGATDDFGIKLVKAGAHCFYSKTRAHDMQSTATSGWRLTLIPTVS